jgi:hypothetical protein
MLVYNTYTLHVDAYIIFDLLRPYIHKENPPKEPVKEAPVVELPKKSLAEVKTKRRKKDPKLDLSLEKHQATPPLSDVRTPLFFCFPLELC